MNTDRLDINQWVSTDNQTPKTKNKPIIPQQPSYKKSLTPSRIQERLSNSPLKYPLQKAIQKCTKDRSTSRSRQTLGKSSHRDDNFRTSLVRKVYQDERETKSKAHTQTYNFIRKYFEIGYLVPTQIFIQRILQEYEGLWGNQNLDQIVSDFKYKVDEIFGRQGVDTRDLIRVTRQDGMIGLILRIFRQIKQQESRITVNGYSQFNRTPQAASINRSFEERLTESQNIKNIKNIVQQFMESMYECMQKQIYNKFNIELRRMVLKYKEAQQILKQINQKIITHADIFEIEQKYKSREKQLEYNIKQLQSNKQQVQQESKKYTKIIADLKNQKDKIQEQNIKLRENLEKFQSVLLNRALQSIPNNNPSLNRQNTSCNSVLNDRTQQFVNSQVTPHPEPFQIKIDTQMIHRTDRPPETQTTATILNPVNQANCNVSPLKRREGYTYETMNSRVSPYAYSPYSSKVTRQF